MRFLMCALLMSLAGPAFADDGDAEAEVAVDERPPQEIIVYGDPYARWDRTRWHVRTQLGLPLPFPLYATINHEMEAVGIELELTMFCEKTWRRSKKRQEVDCDVQDVGLRAASWRPKERYADEILGAMDDMLTASHLQLLVADDGRIMDVGIEGVEGDNDREKAIREQLRRLLLKVVQGFHLQLPPRNQIRENQWLEYDSKLFEIPVVLDTRRNSDEDGTNRWAAIVNSIGGSHVIHQIDRYRGHLVVQSVGKGTVRIGSEDKDRESYFKLDLSSVSIFDEDTGIMTERVWALRGRTTAGSWLSDGRVDPIYFHIGQMRQIELDAEVDVGATGQVARPGVLDSSLPAWAPL